jgi:hypothetical protein
VFDRNMPSGRHESQRFASFSSRGSSRCGIVTLLKSVRSMISNPRVQSTAMRAFRNTRSYDSDGRKNSRYVRNQSERCVRRPIRDVNDGAWRVRSLMCPTTGSSTRNTLSICGARQPRGGVGRPSLRARTPFFFM